MNLNQQLTSAAKIMGSIIAHCITEKPSAQHVTPTTKLARHSRVKQTLFYSLSPASTLKRLRCANMCGQDDTFFYCMNSASVGKEILYTRPVIGTLNYIHYRIY